MTAPSTPKPKPRRKPGRDRRMPIAEHLRELRTRVLLVAAGLAVGAVAGWFCYPWVFDALQRPISLIASQRGTLFTLNFSGVATSLDMQLKVSLFLAVILTSPWWLYQAWRFVAPGLTAKERKYTVGYLAAGIPLFLAGAALSWWLLPQAVAVLTSFTPPGAANIIDAAGYLSFVMRMILAFGLGFELPVVMVALNAVGVVTARTWLKGWRWAVLLSFVFAAVATPTGDAITMTVLAIPVCGLYFAACGLAALHDRRVGLWAQPASAAA